jgi:hypothetical protein
MTNQSDVNQGLTLSDRATLGLLSALEDKKPVTQRSLAVRIGVALGLTNSLLKRAARKGLVKVGEAPAKQYAYYVTPKGFGEKSRLVAEYLSSSLTFFRKARGEFADVHRDALNRGHKRIALYGVGELAEIAFLSAQEVGVELYCIVQPGSNAPVFTGLPVYSSVESALYENVDAIIIASRENPQATYDQLCDHFGSHQIFSVPLLHVTRNGKGRDV